MLLLVLEAKEKKGNKQLVFLFHQTNRNHFACVCTSAFPFKTQRDRQISDDF